MAQEIERKFIVAGEGWRKAAGTSQLLRQGYLAVSATASVRVRLSDTGAAWLTVKTRGGGISRGEYEYPVPAADAEQLLALCADRLEKRRFDVVHQGATWSVDVYGGALAGLVVAELELDAPEQDVSQPDWLGREVTDDPAYRNEALARDGRPG